MNVTNYRRVILVCVQAVAFKFIKSGCNFPITTAQNVLNAGMKYQKNNVCSQNETAQKFHVVFVEYRTQLAM